MEKSEGKDAKRRRKYEGRREAPKEM